MHGNENICLDYYNYCQTIYNTYLYHIKVPSPPKSINNICSNSYINTNGKSKCNTMCSKATCCFTNDNKDNYFNGLEYYNTNANANCQNMNNATCDLYASCQNLKKTDVGFTTNKNEKIFQLIQQTCTENINDIISLSHCFQLCLPASCCFNNTTTTPTTTASLITSSSCSDNIDCMKYERCTIAFHHLKLHATTGENNNNNNATTTNNNNDTTKTNKNSSLILSNEDKTYLIEQTCAPTKIDTKQGWDACYDLCKERSCCFSSSLPSSLSSSSKTKDDDDNDCYNKENKNWCVEYQDCAFVFYQDYESISVSLTNTLLPSNDAHTYLPGVDNE